MIKEDLRKKFIKAAIESMYDIEVFGSLISEEKIEAYFSSELDEILGLNDLKVIDSRYNHFKIPGTTSSDYEQKLIRLGSSEKLVLAGIRHMGGNTTKPFIYIWPSFKLEHSDLSYIVENVYPHFEVFKPLFINFWFNPQLLFNINNDGKLLTIQQCLVGNIQKMLARTEIEVNDELILEKVEDKDYYTWYEKEYTKFHKRYPLMKDRIPVNDIDLMEECRKEGFLYYGIINGKRVGIIAAEKSNLMGLESVYIDEIMIAEQYRGNKYSEVLLQKFVQTLPESIEVLWCHIDSENIPSTKAAIRAGEQVYGIECFYPCNQNL